MYAGFERDEVKRALKSKMEPSYHGNFSSAKRHVLYNFANTQSTLMKKRVQRYMVSSTCPVCHGKRLRRESLNVRFAGLDIADISALALSRLVEILLPYSNGSASVLIKMQKDHPEKVVVTQRITQDLVSRINVLLNLGLGYLSLERSTPTLSPGELQRLRLATQVRSNLFGVVYVLDEPSAGLHPADTESLLDALGELKRSGNSLFVIEHDLDVVRRADWIVDVGPAAGELGGRILYNGPPAGLKQVEQSQTRAYLFEKNTFKSLTTRSPKSWLRLKDVSRNNLNKLDIDFPLGVLTTVTGISGSGKSSLVSQALVELVAKQLGQQISTDLEEGEELEQKPIVTKGGHIVEGMHDIKRLIVVDQKPIGRTPRSNLATYTGLFDNIRKLFAATKTARARRFDAGRFSFNVSKGRCENCEGEGSVMVELLFLPSVYAPCPTCHGTRYNDKTLEIKYRDNNIADVLRMTVNKAWEFFADEPQLRRSFTVLREVGLGYLKLGQPATELSGGEAQRIKLATELQRMQRGNTLYILDEPTTGLHPADIEKLMAQLNGLVESGNTVIVVEHDMRIVAGSDWMIDIGPGAGDEGGLIVAAGTPISVSKSTKGITAPYLRRFLDLTYAKI